MKHLSKVCSMILVICLLLSTIAFAEETIMTQYGRYDETVHIQFPKKSSPKPGLLNGDTADNNPMTRYIADKFDITVEAIWETEESEFANKLALMIAGGSLPDMFTLTSNDYLLFKQLLDNDMLEPLDDAYNMCASDYIKNTLATYEGRNFDPFRGEDGKLYAIVGGRYAYEHNQLWARQDWLDAAGLEMPTTIEDMEAVLEAFKSNPPSESYTGLLLNANSVGGVYDSFSASPLFAAFDAYPGMWITDENGNAVWGSVQPSVKEGLRVLADWYQKGLIDPQFPTRTASGANAALINGNSTGLFFAPWWIGYSITDFNQINPDGVLQNANAPVDKNGNFNFAFPGASNCFVCVRKGFEHPEAVIKLMNGEFDMWRGLDPEADEMILETRNNGADWEYLFPTSGFNVAALTEVADAGALTQAVVDGLDYSNMSYVPQVMLMAEQAKEYAEKGNDAEPGCWLSYVTRYVGSSPNVMSADNMQIVYPAFSFVTDSMADLKPNLDTLEQTTFLKIVTGELPVDAFDQFVEDWYAQGGQIMTDEVNTLIK